MKSVKEKLLPETIKHLSCPLCNGDSIIQMYNCRDSFVTGEFFPVVKCKACGFIFTNDYPIEESIGSYYKSENYISHSDTQRGLINKIYHLARTLMLRKKWRIIRSHTNLSSGRLLDIGCGTGYFAHYMSKKRWIVSGIEKDDDARLFASSKLNVDVYSSEKLFRLEEKYDCITLWHVLEHFHDPDSVMEAIRSALKDSGILALALPNNSSYDAYHYRENWAAWDVPRHLWHFTPKTIELFIKKHGMEIVSIKRLPLDAFYVSLLSEKYRGSRTALLSGFLFGTISFIRSVLNKRKTSSLIYLIRKVKA